MRTTTVAALTPVLPALGTVAVGATKTRRVGKLVRFYRDGGTTLPWTAELQDAVRVLLGAGLGVKVYADDRVYTLRLDGEVVVWDYRDAGKDRDYTVVEVAL